MFNWFDDILAPDSNANDPQERIAARRVRIKKRAERDWGTYNYLEEDIDPDLVVPQITYHLDQYEETYQTLGQLEIQAERIVSNVLVAAQARTLYNRTEKESIMRNMLDRCEMDEKMMIDYEYEMETKLSKYKNIRNFFKIEEFYFDLKTFITSIVEEKDRFIGDVQHQIEVREQEFRENVRQQSIEIPLLIERINNAYIDMMNGYQKELRQLEDAYVKSRNATIEGHMKVWKKLVSERNAAEERYLFRREKAVEAFVQGFNDDRVRHDERFQSTKQLIYADIYTLQVQLQNMKAAYHCNMEKLQYNFQIIRKKQEENLVCKTSQKRRITRLTDVLSRLRAKYNSRMKKYHEQNKVLMREHQRYRKPLKMLSAKAENANANIREMFKDIWLCNEEECKEALDTLMRIDKAICNVVLGIPYCPIEFPFTRNVGPINVSKLYTNVNPVLDEIFKTPNNKKSCRIGIEIARNSSDFEGETNTETATVTTEQERFPYPTLRALLSMICTETPYLLVPGLERTISSCDEDQKLLIRVDALFKALHIEHEEEVHVLARYFDEYTEVVEKKLKDLPDFSNIINLSDQQWAIGSGLPSKKETPEWDQQQPSKCDHSSKSQDGNKETKKDLAAIIGEGNDSDEEDDDLEISPDDLFQSVQFMKTKSPHFNVFGLATKDRIVGEPHPNDVGKVIREFVETRRSAAEKEKKKEKIRSLMVGENKERDNSRDLWYWSQYHRSAEYIASSWIGLEESLTKMLHLLKNRSTQIQSNNAIREENLELRQLLESYVSADVNTDLECSPLTGMLPAIQSLPPTRPKQGVKKPINKLVLECYTRPELFQCWPPIPGGFKSQCVITAPVSPTGTSRSSKQTVNKSASLSVSRLTSTSSAQPTQ